MLFYVTVFFCLLIDLGSMALIRNYTTHLTLWFYAANLGLRPLGAIRMGCLWIILSLQAYAQWGTPFIELLYLIPVTSLGIFLRPRMHRSWHLPLTLCLVALAIQTFLLEWVIMGISPQNFTIRKIFITLISISMMIFLTYRRGNLGNRL